jgi:hypothetical protein
MSQWPDFEVWEEQRKESLRDAEGIWVRWGLSEDEDKVAELLELNGKPRWVAFEERFIIAQKKGKILASLRYRMVSKRLLLGLLVADPWTEEHPMAKALYSGAVALAQEAGIGEVRARPNPCGNYPSEVGYRWRRGSWRADTAPTREVRGELPEGGWRRVLAMLDIGAVPFFRAFRPW